MIHLRVLRRARVVSMIVACAIVLLLIRILWIQTVQYDTYQAKVIEQMTTESTVRADRGSIYDTKFQDKWLANCDEAERFAAYKCSFKTFKVMQLAGMVLWIICLIGQMIFGTGVFATIIVTVFMIIQISVYSVQGIYFAKHPSEVMK